MKKKSCLVVFLFIAISTTSVCSNLGSCPPVQSFCKDVDTTSASSSSAAPIDYTMAKVRVDEVQPTTDWLHQQQTMIIQSRQTRFFYLSPTSDLGCSSPLSAKKLSLSSTWDTTQGDYESHSVSDPEDNNLLPFHGQSNSSIYIIKVSSSHPINLLNSSMAVKQYTIGKQVTAAADFAGCYYSDETSQNLFYGMSSGENFNEGEFRYAHLAMAPFFNYTNDQRHLYERENDWVTWGQIWYFLNVTFPPGTWYFIYAGVVFDLEQENVLTTWKVWLNFSDTFNDIEISTYEGGRTYGLWYGEFESPFIMSTSHKLETMIHGMKTFDIKHRFLYTVVEHPKVKGFWYLRWDTPMGTYDFSMILTEHKRYYDKSKAERCLQGLGEAGQYKLTTSYMDHDPVEFWAFPVYFVGFDIEFL
jgi:hypothetical protein